MAKHNKKFKRYKKISTAQFEDIRAREWLPCRLQGQHLPDFLIGLPADTLNSCIASGTNFNPGSFPNSVGPSPIPGEQIIGGIDVYRNAPDDSVRYNKDWYAVFKRGAGDLLVVAGPYKDSEHWINQIPERYADVEILGLAPATGFPEKARKVEEARSAGRSVLIFLADGAAQRLAPEDIKNSSPLHLSFMDATRNVHVLSFTQITRVEVL